MCLRGRYGFQETAKFGPRFAQVHTATHLITEKVSLSVSVVSRADYAVRETIRVLDSRSDIIIIIYSNTVMVTSSYCVHRPMAVQVQVTKGL
jgi:hypothetical protein